MYVTALKSVKVTAGSHDLLAVIENALPAYSEIPEGSILAITSKIVAICEGSVVPTSQADKAELIARHSDMYLPPAASSYNIQFTITDNTLIPTAGIDESNADGNFILWPRDAQGTANSVRQYLSDKIGRKHFGLIVTDSTCRPLRRGTTGIALSYSGFKPLRSYDGQLDLFGRVFKASQADIAGGLAGAAVLAMGEGAEQTPLCLISDLPAIEFTGRNPSQAELSETTISLEDDLFAPFLSRANWQPGYRKSNP